MALSFAAYILFMRCKEEDGKYYGMLNGDKYPVQDDHAKKYAKKWDKFVGTSLVRSILNDKELWDTDLTVFLGLVKKVTEKLEMLQSGKVRTAINEVQNKIELV